jgi:cob(I)alamin adenosyltransferase
MGSAEQRECTVYRYVTPCLSEHASDKRRGRTDRRKAERVTADILTRSKRSNYLFSYVTV